jgi:hypothetical protein
MKIYQLKIQYDPETVLTVATYLNQSDAFDALADWSENEKKIQATFAKWSEKKFAKWSEKKFAKWSEKKMSLHYHAICLRMPEIYNAYDSSGWVEECDVLDAYDPKSLEFDFKLLDL